MVYNTRESNESYNRKGVILYETLIKPIGSVHG